MKLSVGASVTVWVRMFDQCNLARGSSACTAASDAAKMQRLRPDSNRALPTAAVDA